MGKQELTEKTNSQIKLELRGSPTVKEAYIVDSDRNPVLFLNGHFGLKTLRIVKQQLETYVRQKRKLKRSEAQNAR